MVWDVTSSRVSVCRGYTNCTWVTVESVCQSRQAMQETNLERLLQNYICKTCASLQRLYVRMWHHHVCQSTEVTLHGLYMSDDESACQSREATQVTSLEGLLQNDIQKTCARKQRLHVWMWHHHVCQSTEATWIIHERQLNQHASLKRLCRQPVYRGCTKPPNSQ